MQETGITVFVRAGRTIERLVVRFCFAPTSCSPWLLWLRLSARESALGL